MFLQAVTPFRPRNAQMINLPRMANNKPYEPMLVPQKITAPPPMELEL